MAGSAQEGAGAGVAAGGPVVLGGAEVPGGAVVLGAGEEDAGRVGLSGAVLVVGTGAELRRVLVGFGVGDGDFRTEGPGEGVAEAAWRACGAGSAGLGPNCT
ncbi:MAG TPA: hypothetical protein VIJ82_14670 [Streptosporangiaceae bacterium]